MHLANARWRAIIVAAVLIFLLAALRLFNLAQNAFFVFAAVGALLSLATFPPKWMEWGCAGVIAVALAEAYRTLAGKSEAFFGAGLEDALGFCGLGAVVVLAWKALRNAGELDRFMAACTMPVFAAIAAIVLRLSESSEPRVYDLYLYKVDTGLGGQASSMVARWFDIIPALRDVCAIAYQALPLMLAVVIAIQLRQRGAFPVFPVMVFGLAGLEAPFLYHLVPAVGPEYVFGPRFAYEPHRILALATIKPMHAAPPNSFPSLHFAWALLILWNMPAKSRAAVAGGLLFLLAITLATLGLGEHYAIDLVVAFPFAACVQNTCMARWRQAALCGAIMLGWFCYVRFLLAYAPPAPALIWIATIATIVAACWTTVWQQSAKTQEAVSAEASACPEPAV